MSVLQTTDNYRCRQSQIIYVFQTIDNYRCTVGCGEHNHGLYLLFRPQATTGALWRTQSQTVSVLQTTDNYRRTVENTITDCICSSDHRQLQAHCGEHNHRLYLFFRPQTTNYRCIVENTITDCICSSDKTLLTNCERLIYLDWELAIPHSGFLSSVQRAAGDPSAECSPENKTLESGCHLFQQSL